MVKLVGSVSVHLSGRRYHKLKTRSYLSCFVHIVKVCMCDADMIAIANPDAIFDVPAPAGQCSVVPVEEDAARHGKPLSPELVDRSTSDYGIRGCLWVLEPSAEDFAEVSCMICTIRG